MFSQPTYMKLLNVSWVHKNEYFAIVLARLIYPANSKQAQWLKNPWPQSNSLAQFL